MDHERECCIDFSFRIYTGDPSTKYIIKNETSLSSILPEYLWGMFVDFYATVPWRAEATMIAVHMAPCIGVQIGTNSAYIFILHLNRTQMTPPPHCPKPEIPL